MKKLVVAFTTLSAIFTMSAAINVSAEEHKVQEKESLWSIAQKYDTSVQSLIEVNELDSTIIHPGQHITISQDKSSTKSYTVKKGDTLSEIGREYNVSVKELMDWNDLSNTTIRIGQELKINHTSKASNNTKTEDKQTNKVKAAKESKKGKQDQAAKTFTVTATAYTAKCEGCTGVTATGINLTDNPNKKVIAVDPSVIPLGTEVYVEGYGKAIAGDTGGAIKGKKIDVHLPTEAKATNWGVKTVEVTILD
ncbi:LysM peptidoglycan-binding domain-containing protein [Pseudogracilibacillus sp. SE30717A]|uniref:LysM peptidoglycan-binding domain-containing protein n=1 Tax=Pseudogracilibacillus sp. SE30717A TaxID=3098293 RepID=UPI00300E5249